MLVLQSSLLAHAGFRHGFFTRQGGMSPGPFESLNVSISVGDDRRCVQENLSRAGQVLGLPGDSLYFVDQIHSATIFELSASMARHDILLLKGDAVMSGDPSIACCVRTADCVPLFIADKASGRAVAVHSGWRGTVLNIAGAAVKALCNGAGVRMQGRLIAAIGPHIEACCFELGSEVAKTISQASPVSDVIHLGPKGRPHADLRKMIRFQLLQAGIAEDCIDDVPGCTFCDSTRFFSYRRDGAKSGRMLAAIVPNPTSV